MATMTILTVAPGTRELSLAQSFGQFWKPCSPASRIRYKQGKGLEVVAAARKDGIVLLNEEQQEQCEDFETEDDDELSCTTTEGESSEEENLGFDAYEFESEQSADERELDPLEERAQKIDELCASVRESLSSKITARQLIALYNFRLDKFQRLAIEGFLKGSSVVVSAPTSSGKTLIAEAAAAATLARGRRMFYTTPLKALSNQKFREFRSVFGEASVGLLTGDISFNRDAPIVIMTAEILRNKLYLGAGSGVSGETLVGVDVVVLDEIHYLSDIYRGTVWEETVIYCPKTVQLICLSATIANPEELAGWIAKVHGPTELITSSKRPVPLMWHISRRSGMLPLLNTRGTGMNKNLVITQEQMKRIKRKLSYEMKVHDDPAQLIQKMEVPRISDTLKQMVERNMLPAIWFILSRKRCDEAVGYLDKASLLSEKELGQVTQALKIFREQHPEGVRESAVGPLYQGIAAHHAGCLPVWKTFIEELFQRGLVKVVFATETLAAGINMPARTTVLSSSVSRSGGQIQLSANSILQMAGRAGRRGIDTQGHVVVVQTPFRGPKDCYKMLRSASDPLISQFTANYGMVLNLLAGTDASDEESSEDESSRGKNKQGRSLSEARSLVEKSFGNFMGSEILLGSKAKLAEIQAEIDLLESGKSSDSLSKLYDEKLHEYNYFTEKLQMKQRKERNLRLKLERLKSSIVQDRLRELKDQFPYVLLSYSDSHSGSDITVSSIYASKLMETSSKRSSQFTGEPDDCMYISRGSDNFWYRFSESAVKSIHGSDLPSEEQKYLRSAFPVEGEWERLADNILVMRNPSTSFSVIIPEPTGFTREYLITSEEMEAAEKLLLTQQRSIAKMSRRMATEFDQDEMQRLSDKLKKLRQDKVARLKAKSERIANRIKQMQPSGWNEFLQAVNVLKAAGAMQQDSFQLLPLGETARAIRGTNELWLALALGDKALTTLKPSELAAAAAALVTESTKARFEGVFSTMYEPSSTIKSWAAKMESQRQLLVQVQEAHNLEFSCELDPQMAGFVEAWASGVSWKELEVAKTMDEGDFARLLRRTIDLLAQLPHLPHLDQSLVKTAKEAAKLMDRPPISESLTE